MALSKVKDTDIFLLGKTGNGKSSTGNSILGRNAFKASDGSDSETNYIQSAFTERPDHLIKVVDGPGILDTRFNKKKAVEKMVLDMAHGIFESARGFHSLIVVMKYGNRVTQEDLDVLNMLKKCLGPDFVRDFCIIVFTHGEQFDLQYKNKSKLFTDWCMEQTGELRKLLEECNYRAVLFYNLSDDNTKSRPVEELLSMVDALGGRRYTNVQIELVAKKREKIIREMQTPDLKDEFQCKISHLYQTTYEVFSSSKITRKNLMELKAEVTALQVYINMEDKGTGDLNELSTYVNKIEVLLQNYEELREETERQELNDLMNKLKIAEDRRKASLWEKAAHVILDILRDTFQFAFSYYFRAEHYD